MSGFRIRMFEPFIEDEDVNAVVSVLKSGWLAHGPIVESFEEKFAEYVGVKYAAAVSNGTIALMLSLKALGIGNTDKVLVPDYTFIATATSALMVGATPIFVDVDYKTFNMDVNDLQKKISEVNPKAIIVVHLFGHPADIRAIKEIASDKKIILIEDAAQAHGAEAWGKKVGSFGDAAIFSFYATKNMTTGEGGIIVSDNKQVIEKVKLLRNHGQTARYIHEELGGNYRMTSIQAALGEVQLKKLDKLNDIRRKNASLLTAKLSDLKDYIEPPYEAPWAKHVYHVYALKLFTNVNRKCVIECMSSKGIETAIHYPLPLHKQPLFQKLGYRDCCNTASTLAERELSIPIHPKLTDRDIDFIAEAFKQCLKSCI
ncbi:MAG: DegT/DnrJ/EryC1/StrS family aminotransferase [Ignisphaera sp.]